MTGFFSTAGDGTIDCERAPGAGVGVTVGMLLVGHFDDRRFRDGAESGTGATGLRLGGARLLVAFKFCSLTPSEGLVESV